MPFYCNSIAFLLQTMFFQGHLPPTDLFEWEEEECGTT